MDSSSTVHAAIGAGAAAAGNGQTQIILVQAAELDVLAAAGQATWRRATPLTVMSRCSVRLPGQPIAAEADLALADRIWSSIASEPVMLMRAGPPRT